MDWFPHPMKIVLVSLLACAATSRAAAQCAMDPGQTLLSVQSDPDFFGTAVAARDPWLFVSEVSSPDGVQGAGGVEAFRRSPAGWELRQVLTASDADEGDRFGTDLAVSGALLVVGAGDDDDACGGPAYCNSGSVYVFELGAAGWTEVAKLTASDAASGHRFGSDVAVHESTIVVGAYLHGPSSRGAAYVFERQAGVWVETALLLGNDTAPGDDFGKAVAVWGDTVAVGSPFHDLPLNQAGAAYVFTRTPAGWVQSQKVLPLVAQAQARFGSSVSLRDDGLLVGAETEDSGNGAAYFFQRIGAGWFQQARVHSANCPNGRFGREVALGDRRAVVASQCSTYAYELMGVTWEEVRVLPAPNGTLATIDLALGNRTIVVSDAYDDSGGDNAGAAWTYDLTTGTSYCTAYTNSTGSAAEIWHLGCPSVGLNAFALVAAPVPDDVGTFVYGRERAILPFGGQLLCVGGTLHALRPEHATGGVLFTPFDFLAHLGSGTIFPGETWNFQAWFRDSAVGPGAINASNGLEVAFVP